MPTPYLHMFFQQTRLTWVFPKIVVPPKSSIPIGFSIINHPYWGPLFLETYTSSQIWDKCGNLGGWGAPGLRLQWKSRLNGGTPKWMVYNGKLMDDLGVPLFSETSIYTLNNQVSFFSLIAQVAFTSYPGPTIFCEKFQDAE